jgi:hypothetical protein
MADRIVNLAHRSRQLQRDAGTYYSRFYADADRIYGLFDSYSWLYQLLLGEAEDASLLFYRLLMPVLHRDWVMGIELDEATWRDGEYRILTYGASNDLAGGQIKYGDKYLYGIPAEWMPGAVILPDDVVGVDFCCDLPIDPTVIYLKDEDFRLVGNLLYFNVDPFDLFPSSGESPNRKLIFWLRSVYRDRAYVQDRLGFLVQAAGSSTDTYRDFCNLVVDGIVSGVGYHCLIHLVCLLFDVPCITETEETVEELGVSDRCRWLATDKHVYYAPLAAAFQYSVGDVLPIGTVLTDAVVGCRGIELKEAVPLVFERRFLGADYKGGLIFPNEDTPVSIDAATGNYSFRIVGDPDDVKLFWDTFNFRGGQELLRAGVYNGVRGLTINPARFIYTDILYPRLQLFLVRYGLTGAGRLPMMNTGLFRKLLSPGLLFSLLVEAEPVGGELVLGLSGTACEGVHIDCGELTITPDGSSTVCAV